MADLQDNFCWLINWFHSQCYEHWENSHNIVMYNIDGPNWYLKVDVDATELAEQPFQAINIKRSERDWLNLSIKEAFEHEVVQGTCGLFNLPEMIQIFRDWAQSIQSRAPTS